MATDPAQIGLLAPITQAPPSYGQAVEGASNLDFVDFHPEKIPGSGFRNEYERFDVLVKRGNEWLAANPTRRVLTGESVEMNFGKEINMKEEREKVIWVELDKERKEKYLRFLRLWTIDKKPDEPAEPQQIGYINIVPKCIHGKAILSNPEFVSFPDTLSEFNAGLRKNPIPGKVINIETQEMKMNEYSGDLDPDKSYWKEGKGRSSYFVYTIRVFYEVGPPSYESLGTVDFVPQKDSSASSSERYEQLPVLLNRAHHWVTQQSAIRVTNIQSINFKVFQKNMVLFKIEKGLDTTVSSYRENDDGVTKFVRIVRVCYTCLSDPSSAIYDMPTGLTLKNFIPSQTKGGPGCCESYEFEKTTPSRERIAAWFRVSGARPLNCETVPVVQSEELLSADECDVTYDPQAAYSWKTYMNVFRVYFPEPFVEPPLHVLPPLPEVQRGDNACYQCCCCCCIACCCNKSEYKATEIIKNTTINALSSLVNK